MIKYKIVSYDKVNTFYRTESELAEIFRLFQPTDVKNAVALADKIKAYLLRKQGYTLKASAKTINRSEERMRCIEVRLDSWLKKFETKELFKLRHPHLFDK